MNSHWHIDEGEFPAGGSPEEQYRFLLRYAILAPSTCNTQPWKFELSDDGIAVFADYSRRMPVGDPGNRELLMSIGAAIMNLRAAAARFGLECRVRYTFSGDSEAPLAFVSFSPSTEDHEVAAFLRTIFPGIVKRHTNRNPFLLTRIPESILSSIRGLAEGTQVTMTISTDGRLNEQVAHLVAAADRLLLGDVGYRKESAEWVRSSWGERPDGIPGYSLGVSGVAAALAPWTTRVLDMGRIRAAKDKNLCIDAPGLVVLSSEDSVPQFLETGEVLEKLLLRITCEGMQTSYFNLPIKSPQFRVRLRGLLGLTSWPQLLLRIGFCFSEPVATPRRPLEEVIHSQHVH